MPLPDVASRRPHELLALAGLTLAALALRLADLDRFPFWQDEAATWWYAKLIADGRLMEGIRLEPTPPLYYLLIAAMSPLLGPSDWALRLPSAVFGAASVPVLFCLVRRLGRCLTPTTARLASWIAAGLLTVHPLHVFYSREARVYPLLLLLTMLLWLSLRQALDDDGGRSWLRVAAVLLVAAYSHYYSLFLFATAGLLILMLAPDARGRWRGMAAVAAPGLLFLPYVVLTLPFLRESGAAWSIDALYAIFPGDRSLARVLELGLFGADYPVYLREIALPATSTRLRWTSLAAQVALLAVAVYRLSGSGSAGRRDLAFWLVAWHVPILVPWAVTHGFRAIFHPGRHDVYGLWGPLFGLAVGLASLAAGGARRKLLATSVAALLLLAATGRLALLHGLQPRTMERERAGILARHVSSPADDAPTVQIWTLGVQRLLTERYLRLALARPGEVPIASFPASTDSHPGWCDAAALMQDRDAVLAEARQQVAELPATVRRVFVVTAGPPPAPDGGMTAQGFLDAALLRALERAGWRRDDGLGRPDLDLVAFRRAGS